MFGTSHRFVFWTCILEYRPNVDAQNIFLSLPFTGFFGLEIARGLESQLSAGLHHGQYPHHCENAADRSYHSQCRLISPASPLLLADRSLHVLDAENTMRDMAGAGAGC